MTSPKYADPQPSPADDERRNEQRECDELPGDLRRDVGLAAKPHLQGE